MNSPAWWLRFSPNVVFVVFVVVVAGGCVEPDADPEPPSSCCESDRECAGGFICSGGGQGACGTCVAFLCTNDRDCVAAGDFCDVGRAVCMPPLVCSSDDPGVGCVDADLCLVDEDGSGACTAPPLAARCEIVPARAVAVDGVARTFEVIALDRASALLPRTAARGISGDGVSRNADGSGTLMPRCVGPAPCDVVVDAEAFGATCSAAVRVLPPLDPGSARVIVVDERSGAAVAAARVVVAVAGIVVEGVSDDDGVVVFAGVDGAFFDHVSAFADGFERLTVVAPAGLDVQLPLRRAGLVAAAGELVVGESQSFIGDVVAGLAGLSYDGLDDVTSLSFFGASGTILVDIDGITEDRGALMPFSSGGTLALGAETLRSRYVAVAAPGERLLWSFGARLPLARFGAIFSGARDNDIDVRLEMLRLSAGLAMNGIATGHSVAVAAPPAVSNLDVFGDDLPVAATDVVASARPAAAVEVVLAGVASDVTDVIVAVAAAVPGRGLVLLGGGVIATLDEFGAPGVAPGSQTVFFAPPHGGLEGQPLVLLAFDVRLANLKSDDELGRNRRRLGLAPLQAGADRAFVVVPPLQARADFGGFDGEVLDVTGAARLRARSAGQTWTIATTTAARVDVGALVVAIDAGVADFGGSVLDAVDLGVGVAGVVGDGFRAGADPGVTLARQRAGR